MVVFGVTGPARSAGPTGGRPVPLARVDVVVFFWENLIVTL